MKPCLLHYLGGGEVRVGDRVRYKGVAGRVVFVSDGEDGEFSPGFSDYRGYEAGLMIFGDDGEMMFVIEPNEFLELIRPVQSS